MIIAPIFSIFVKDILGASIEMVGLVVATFFIFSSLTRVLFGVFGGGKKTLFFYPFAFLFLSICVAIYPLTRDIYLVILLRAFQGFVSASIFTVSITLAALTLPRPEIDKGVGSYLASTSLGLLAGPVITTFSIQLFGVSTPFYFASLVAILGCCTAFFLTKKIFSIEKRWHILERGVKREGVRNKMGKIIRNRSFAIAFIGNFAFFFFFSIFLAYGPIYAKNILYFSPEQVSVLFFAYYAVTTITRFSLNRILKKVSKGKLLVINAILASLLSFMLTLKADLIFAIVFSLIGIAHGSFYSVGSMLIAENIDPQRKMLANSLFGVGLGVGQAIAPIITAVFISLYGLEYGFLISAMILSISAGLIIIINYKPKKSMILR